MKLFVLGFSACVTFVSSISFAGDLQKLLLSHPWCRTHEIAGQWVQDRFELRSYGEQLHRFESNAQGQRGRLIQTQAFSVKLDAGGQVMFYHYKPRGPFTCVESNEDQLVFENEQQTLVWESCL